MNGVTQEEISKLTRAMKDEEFRSHMDEYTREVSDPAHRKEYIQYLEQLEAKGEMPEGQGLLRTEPGCCAKTSIRFKNGQTQKLFINIVHCDSLDDISFKPSDKDGGKQVHLPYSLSPPRPDRDLKDQYCMTADCAVSSYTFHQALQNPQILKMIIDTAADGLAERFLKGYEEVKKDFKLLERMKCKGGFPMPMSVKAELLKGGAKSGPRSMKSVAEADAVTPSELKQMRAEAKAKRDAHKMRGEEKPDGPDTAEQQQQQRPDAEDESKAQRIRVPKHRLIHSGAIDLADYMESHGRSQVSTTTVPKVLRLIVELPTVRKSSDVSLEVTCDNVVVEVPDKFYLDLPLSYEVEDAKGKATFDKSKSELTLELPVVPKPPIFRPESVLSDQAVAAAAEIQDDVEGGGTGGDEAGDAEGNAGRDAAEGDAPDAPAGDWIDRLPEASPAASPAFVTDEPAVQPVRERLEFDDQSMCLHIAQPPEEEEEEPAGGSGSGAGGVEEQEEAEDGLAFVPAEEFMGARPGYYFSTGEEGLGYYRDRRWRGRSVGRREVAAPAAAMPFVEDVTPKPNSVVAEVRPPLPEPLQRYVDFTRALGRRVAQADCVSSAEEQVDPALECRQNRQNILLSIDLTTGTEVADLQVAITGHRLQLSFASRLASGLWRRHRLRRTFCGLVDVRQWCAEVEDGGAGQPVRLQLIFRKVRKGEMWPQILDADAPLYHTNTDELATVDAPDDTPGLAAQAGVVEASETATAEEAVVEQTQDSAELDVSLSDDGARPNGTPAPAAAAVPIAAVTGPAGMATAAMVQSAVVMGQSVLLRNRLIYQL
eukprot:CAMPEP_0176181032 /NCGR_PEP_ID=MMETSP0120_2-20121206/92757_1 /TAXON_ID=160619 /ORGANISM="Kryptoperidinium foliaceum, Strain CCMP 1326" /LENGTH=821 /DNA_ID=CAMNT_0017519247 /DNA_START=68 /DNA_END=2529 /DNA_ORIENTATION=+